LPPHRYYVEPFAGSASIFFYKKPAEYEVLNDLDPNIVSVFKNIQKMDATVPIPDVETRAKAQAFYDRKKVTKPIDILVQSIFRACGGWMGAPLKPGAKLMKFPSIANRLKYLPEYKARLRGVHITNQDYEEVVSHNDSKDTVFFLDPPYEKSDLSLGYAKGSDTFDFTRFAKVLSGIKGKWLMTINDSPMIRDLFKSFTITPVMIIGHHANNGVGPTGKTTGSSDRPELLISNYALPKDASEFAPKNLKFRGGGVIHRKRVLKKLGLPDTGYSLPELSKASGVSLDILQQVYNRGIGAYKTQPSSVRMKGTFKKGVNAPMSQKLSKEQWALARVYSFLDKNPKHDQDLHEREV
jgi:DNA adenine methylase